MFSYLIDIMSVAVLFLNNTAGIVAAVLALITGVCLSLLSSSRAMILSVVINIGLVVVTWVLCLVTGRLEGLTMFVFFAVFTIVLIFILIGCSIIKIFCKRKTD